MREGKLIMSCDRNYKVFVGDRESLYKYLRKYGNIKNIYCLFTGLPSKTSASFLRSGYATKN